ncbi:DUF6221 family protein [Streptomyces sp. NPDC059680]|uniref:DUF6221 family protein n=1 Tax=Streptomyces sp. NPDC059680 TaxID=3346904 RepID=UPI0036A75D07
MPARIRERIAIQRRILADCERRIRNERYTHPSWPLDSILAFEAMKTLGLPFELHPAWQDSWHP